MRHVVNTYPILSLGYPVYVNNSLSIDKFMYLGDSSQRVSAPSLSQYTAKIRQFVQGAPERIFIRVHHIEKDRIWREITEEDVRRVLANGKVDRLRQDDLTLFWRGSDADGRLIELQCSLIDDSGEDTLVIVDAIELRVGTAYEPGKEDEKAKREWLKAHPDYEEGPGGKLQKKISVTRIENRSKEKKS